MTFLAKYVIIYEKGNNMLNEFENYLQVNRHTTSRLDKIKPFLNYMKESNIDVTALDFTTYMGYINKQHQSNKSEGYINTLMDAVRCFYRFLIDKNEMDESIFPNVLNKIKKYNVSSKLKNFLVEEDLEYLMTRYATYFEDYKHPKKVRALLYFWFFTGLRLQELLDLRRADIDLEKNIVKIRIDEKIKRRTKNKKERVQPFPKRIGNMLSEYFQIEKETINAFCMNKNMICFLLSKLNDIFNKDIRIHAHLFRHSFGMLLARMEFEVEHARILMGHSDIKSTLIYFKPDEKMVHDMYKKKIK